MPKLRIEGIDRAVIVDESFRDLSPEEQDAFVKTVYDQYMAGATSSDEAAAMQQTNKQEAPKTQQPQIQPAVKAKPQPQIQEPQAPQPKTNTLLDFARGVPQGLGNIAVGGVQALTDLGEAGARRIEKRIYGDNMPVNEGSFGNRLATQVGNMKEKQSQSPLAERAGMFVGEVAPFMGVGAGSGIIKGAAKAGAAMGATSPLAEVGLMNRAQEAGKTAGIAAFTGGALKGVGKMTRKKPAPQTSEDLKDISNKAYQKANDIGGKLTSKFSEKFTKELDEILPKTDLGRSLAGKDGADDIINLIKGKFSAESVSSSMVPTKRTTTLQELQELDEFLSTKIDDLSDNGIINKISRKLLTAQNKLRNLIDKATPDDIEGGKAGFEGIKQARKLWSSATKLKDIERIISKAEMTDNPATAIKTGFRTLYNNPSRIKGYSKAERALIKKAGKSGKVDDIMRISGSRLLPIITMGASGSATASLLAQGGSMAARAMVNRSQTGKARNLTDLIGDVKAKPKPTNKGLESLGRGAALGAAKPASDVDVLRIFTE